MNKHPTPRLNVGALTSSMTCSNLASVRSERSSRKLNAEEVPTHLKASRLVYLWTTRQDEAFHRHHITVASSTSMAPRSLSRDGKSFSRETRGAQVEPRQNGYGRKLLSCHR